MVNPYFKKWIQLAKTVKQTIPNCPLLNCPNCNSNNIAYEYIGDSQKREGYFLTWCNNCLEGLHISRIDIPELAKMIPF